MPNRRLTRAFATAVLAGLALFGVEAVSSTTASAAPAGDPSAAAVRTVYYNASGAAEFISAVNQGAAVWNASVTNVRLVAGSPATVTIVADNGWPRAQPRGLGAGTIWMGRQAVNQGHNPTRIAAHEFGHILGLPDNRTGRCTDLMSGSSAPASCTNARPSAAEAARVNSLFAGSAVRAADPVLVF